ncbi:MAG: glycine betaine ABC transporter substrate-binding protein [Bacillota bacterium]
MRVWLVTLVVLVTVGGWARSATHEPPSVRVGSKSFTESVILGELASQLAQSGGASVVYKRELGGSRVLWNGLRSGEIDLYPEYTGTLIKEILAAQSIHSPEQLEQVLSAAGVAISGPLGFNNTYAIGMREDVAQRLGITRISDLKRYPQLRFAMSNEFMDRADGWPALQRGYALPQNDVRGMDHDLAYRALENGAIDAMDLYSTDAEIAYYHLRVLQDDLKVFPEYQAVYLYRADLARRAPEALQAILRLEGRVSPTQMTQMNARVKLQHVPEAQVAADFLAHTLAVHTNGRSDGVGSRILHRTGEHLFLVGVSLLAAIAVAVPLGIVAARYAKLGQIVLGVVAGIYTIPSLALLVFMIPLLGIGAWPAIVALFLYSLLPIVRNTQAGLVGIPPPIRESAEVLGLSRWARLRRVELPLASQSILAGINTSAVINVSTATLGALIGAGGYGQPILTGIRLDSVSLILEGAIPAAMLALLVQGLFQLLERILVPRGLRLKPETR